MRPGARRIAVVALAVSFALAQAPAAGTISQPSRLPLLSREGTLVWRFEGLLHRIFGNRTVWVAHGNNFSCAGSCGPLAKYSPYRYVFRRSRAAGFILASRHFRAGAFGNYAAPLLVRGEAVACNRRRTTFLVSYADAIGLALGCLPPA